MKLTSLTFVASLLAAAPALAQSDVYLQWDDCPSAGLSVKTFACNTNSGNEVLIGSFVTNAPAPQVVSIESTIYAVFPDNVMPSWWNLGACRPASAIQLSTDFSAGPSTCVNPWPAGSVGGVLWDSPPGGVGGGRLRVAQAVPSTSAFAISASVHYYAFKLLLSHAKSTGTNACAGCQIPAALYLREVRLRGLNEFEQVHSISFETRDDPAHFADWQCDGTPRWDWNHNVLDGYDYGPGCTVPARRNTWGNVKSLYR